MSPTYKFKEEMENLKASSFANLMNYIADKNNLWDKPIDTLDWDVDTSECYDIDESEDDEDEWY